MKLTRISPGVRWLPGVLFGVLAPFWLLLAETASSPDATPAADPAPGPVVWIKVHAIIHPMTADYVIESLASAEDLGAQALVIELDTPGGLLTSTRDIFKAMLAARIPVVVFVGPRGAQAASAGFFLLMAADLAVMAPGTNTGAAHPVGGQGEDIEGNLGEKVEQDAAATIRALASQHGRNLELAEAAVVKSRSFSAEEALKSQLIDFIAADADELLRQLDGRTVQKLGEQKIVLATAKAEVVPREMGAFKELLSAIAHPNIAYILMALGMIGLYMELSHPGAIFPGVFGAICLLLGFYALSVLPVNYAGVALILLALVLFIAEIKVPSYGLLTVGGVIALILGSLMLFRDTHPELRVDWQLIASMVTTILALVAFLTIKALRALRSKVTTGKEGLLMEVGITRSALAPQGKVFVHGELWNAVAVQPIAAGTRVRVVAVDGLTLRVEPLPPEVFDT